MNLTHKLQEASLEHQVLDEELDRGGYIPAEESSEQLAIPATSQAPKVVSKPIMIDTAICDTRSVCTNRTVLLNLFHAKYRKNKTVDYVAQTPLSYFIVCKNRYIKLYEVDIKKRKQNMFPFENIGR